MTHELNGRLAGETRANRLPPLLTSENFSHLLSVVEADFDLVTPLCDAARPRAAGRCPSLASSHAPLARGDATGASDSQRSPHGSPPPPATWPAATWPLFAPYVKYIANWLQLQQHDPAVAAALVPPHVSPRLPFYGGGLTAAARERAVAEACPDIEACAEAVRKVCHAYSHHAPV